MKQWKKTVLAFIWILIAPVALNYIWGRNLDRLPRPPESFSIWLIDLYGAKNAEQIADLEFVFGLTVSLAIVSICTALVLFIWKCVHKRHSQSS